MPKKLIFTIIAILDMITIIVVIYYLTNQNRVLTGENIDLITNFEESVFTSNKNEKEVEEILRDPLRLQLPEKSVIHFNILFRRIPPSQKLKPSEAGALHFSLHELKLQTSPLIINFELSSRNLYELVFSQKEIINFNLFKVEEGKRNLLKKAALVQSFNKNRFKEGLLFYSKTYLLIVIDGKIELFWNKMKDFTGNMNFKTNEAVELKQFVFNSGYISTMNSMLNRIGLIDDENGYHWNGYFPEHYIDFRSKENEFIQRIKLANITKKSILLPFGSKISWSVIVPSEGWLHFSFNLVDKYTPPFGKDNFSIIITPSEGEKKVTKQIESLRNINPDSGWIDYSLGLKEFKNKEVTIEFDFNSDEELAKNDSILLIANPQVRTLRTRIEKNVIIILLDTLRPDHLGCYGYKRDTSANIDKFATEGILFENIISSASWTLPSHASIFTSLFPRETGFRQLGLEKPEEVWLWHTNASRILTENLTLAECLKNSGYITTAITGGAYISPIYGFDRGFDYYEEYSDFQNSMQVKDISTEANKTIEWLKENRNEKFFLFFHSYEIHAPYNRSYYKPENETDITQRIIADYDSGIRYADFHIGRILTTLKELGIFDNTFVLITSDHGEDFREFSLKQNKYKNGNHGATLYDSELKVPLIIGGALIWNGKNRVKSLGRTVDIMPTILDLVGSDIPSGIRGRSLLPFLENTDRATTRMAYADSIYLDRKTFPRVALRNEQYKLIKNQIPADWKGSENPPKLEFYDITNDPNESKNIVKVKQKEVNAMLKKLGDILNSIFESAESLPKLEFNTSSIYKEKLIKSLKSLGYLGN